MERIIFDSAESIDALLEGRRTVVIADTNVAGLYDGLIGRFENIIIPAGEEHKTLVTAEEIAHRLVGIHADRQTFLLGIGGGVVCDLAGFVAAIWMRGVRYGLVPTTLLAQADAAVGGKNGVDLDGLKNLLGTFGKPEFVLCDIDFLNTLPARELRSGLAEVLKAGIVGDAELFAMLERGDAFNLAEIVRRAIAVKTAIVARDRFESGERRLLNLGHTFGHAVETVAAGAVLHGEAVAIGMAAATGISAGMGLLTPDTAMRIVAAIELLGLPVRTDLPREELMAAMRVDKKGDLDGVNFVLPTAIGSCTVHKITLARLAELL